MRVFVLLYKELELALYNSSRLCKRALISLSPNIQVSAYLSKAVGGATPIDANLVLEPS